MKVGLPLFPTPSILPIRVWPKWDESLAGYLIRLTSQYNLKSPAPIRRAITNKPMGTPNCNDLSIMSRYCGIPEGDLLDLFGMDKRVDQGHSQWRIGHSWINQERYVSSRALSYCPQCLRENNYLKASWEIVFTSVCNEHGCNLTYVCPSCHKPPNWFRSSVMKCQCGADLTKISSTPSAVAGDYCSRMIINKAYGLSDGGLTPDFPNALKQTISDLSLEAWLELIWFLGESVPIAAKGRFAHGRKKPGPGQHQLVVDRAIQVLMDWPNAFYNYLDMRANVPTNSTLPRVQFGPIHNYFRRQPVTSELIFLRNAYIQYLYDYCVQKGCNIERVEEFRQMSFKF